jgi:hypothetical protein
MEGGSSGSDRISTDRGLLGTYTQGGGSMEGSFDGGLPWPKIGNPRWSLSELNVARAEVDKRHKRLLIVVHTREWTGHLDGSGARCLSTCGAAERDGAHAHCRLKRRRSATQWLCCPDVALGSCPDAAILAKLERCLAEAATRWDGHAKWQICRCPMRVRAIGSLARRRIHSRRQLRPLVTCCVQLVIKQLVPEFYGGSAARQWMS